MAWSTPVLHAVGDILTASDWNISSNDISLLGGATSTANTSSGTTTSTSYGDLTATAVGPALTVTTGAQAIVIISASMSNSTTNDGCAMAVAVSGATTIAANDAQSLASPVLTDPSGTVTQMAGLAIYSPGILTAGTNTFTAKYRASVGGTATFSNRNIAVFPLP